MDRYKGIVQIENNTAYINAGGIKVKLEGDIQNFASYNGQLSIVQGDQDGDVIRHASIAPQAESAGQADEEFQFNIVINVLKEHQTSLTKIPGVLGVRPGYSTDPDKNFAPVIILLTNQKIKTENYSNMIGNIPVEQRLASPLEIKEGFISLQAWEGVEQEAGKQPPNINYTPPTNVSLDEHQVSNITCHVGPDAGWRTLKPFLEGTTKSLTVAMFEFYAKHIQDTMTELGEQTEASLNMILQVDKNDEDAQKLLENSWGDRVNFVKASVKGPNRIFNNSYHTKVAVSDSKAFWLSSGNWSPTSQPLIEPGSESFLYRKGNREWHVIVEDKKLAGMYEKFIKYDIDQARKVTEEETEELLPDLLIPQSLLEMEAGIVQPHPFEPKKFANDGETVKVQPLMSPDNYAKEVHKLIEGAKHSLYLQFAYINQPSFGDFENIINTISEKMRSGLDVKILVGTNQKPDAADFLIANKKWKRSMFRKQTSKLHNKGILIDGKIAGVGSNNWSNDGTQYNRDTTLIFYSRPIAQYYTKVFLFDWENLSKPIGLKEEITPLIAPAMESTPLGMIRIPWKAWFD